MSSPTNQQQELPIATQKGALVPTRNVFEKGSLTSDQVDKIKLWRSKYSHHQLEQRNALKYSVAAAATGALLQNAHKSTSAGPSNGLEKNGVAKGPSADSEWGDNLILL